jgi:transcriptional regulator with XRE-family HTH domain
MIQPKGTPAPMTTVPAPNQMLRAWREAHGLTRAQMARALINTPTAWRQHHFLRCGPELIAGWETGRIRWPSAKYQAALRDLTGQEPASLGFTRPPHPPTSVRAVPPPSSPPTAGTPDAVIDLTALAAELRQRGYTTHLSVNPPRLTVDSPGLPRPSPDPLPGPEAA